MGRGGVGGVSREERGKEIQAKGRGVCAHVQFGAGSNTLLRASGETEPGPDACLVMDNLE